MRTVKFSTANFGYFTCNPQNNPTEKYHVGTRLSREQLCAHVKVTVYLQIDNFLQISIFQLK